MEAYAVVETGGKQYRVQEGNLVDVELIAGEAGDTITLDQVLALSDGNSLSVGTPVLEGASVTAELVEHFRGKKLVAFKKKRRKGYKRKVGHRQSLTRLRVVGLGGSSSSASAEPAAETEAAPAETTTVEGDE